MDFHTLTRRELQALCKVNKIPANMTNVAMANALKDLEFVEGIEEVMKPSESEIANSSVESPEKSDMMSSAPRTSRRAAIRPEISHTMTRTRRSTRRMPPEDQVKNDVIETPAAPTARRRATTTSVSSKMESLLKESVDTEQDGEQTLNEKKDLPKTPGTRLTSRRRQVKENTSVRPVYSTRRSARLASKYEEELSKEDAEMSQTAMFDSFTDETYEILDVNSKLCSLHLDDEQGKADSSAFSNGNENQNVASKELGADMHQNSEEHATEEIINGLIENYDFSAGKESNDVEVDLQQGADLVLEGQEAICDNTAGEVSEYVVEKAGDEMMVEDYSHFKEEEEEEEEDSIAVEDVDVQPPEGQVLGADDENKLHHGNEISEWEVVNVDALNKSHKLASADEMMILLSKQLDEDEEDEDKGNNTNGISDYEVEDVNLQPKFHEVVVIGEQLGATSCNEELDTNENSEVVGNGIILTKQLDEVINTKEISNTDVEEEDVNDEEELDTKENSECEVEDHGMVLDNEEESNADLHWNMALSNQPSVNEDDEISDDMQEEKLVDPASKDLNSTLMLDPPAHISVSDVAETDSDNTFQSNKTTPREPVVTDDKENIDNSGMKLVVTKEKLKKKGNAEVKNQKPLEDLSLRQLTKMMKEMKIQNAEKSAKAAVSRPALQHVPENCLVGESRNRSEDYDELINRRC
ncbi:bud site selection protein BUD4-like isoform X2 [Ipomoea triloba]|uniref:bud site selection protein BUD4-like isoform X2 n=1 Tax=Ipomoea triloba TaxID=35885 RepID=UPI00125E1767|nr:bud site selection protein BUD4-like isoform X2 [Ipomoea triloba]